MIVALVTAGLAMTASIVALYAFGGLVHRVGVKADGNLVDVDAPVPYVPTQFARAADDEALQSANPDFYDAMIARADLALWELELGSDLADGGAS